MKHYNLIANEADLQVGNKTVSLSPWPSWWWEIWWLSDDKNYSRAPTSWSDLFSSIACSRAPRILSALLMSQAWQTNCKDERRRMPIKFWNWGAYSTCHPRHFRLAEACSSNLKPTKLGWGPVKGLDHSLGLWKVLLLVAHIQALCTSLRKSLSTPTKTARSVWERARVVWFHGPSAHIPIKALIALF